MRLAVTGGAGFIGSAVIELARSQGHEAVAIDRHFGHDVTDPKVAGLLRGSDAVVHLAGVLGTSELLECPDQAIDVNLRGTLRVLEACRDHGLRYVGITVPDPHWPSIYQVTKLAAVRLASAFHENYDVPVSHVRAFNVYGPGQKVGSPQKIIPTFATRAWGGEPIPIWGDGSQTVDLVHVDHVAEQLLAQVDSEGDDDTIDAGSGRDLHVIDVARLVLDITGSRLVEFLPMRKGESEHTRLCAEHGRAPFLDRFEEVVRSYKPAAEVAA